MNLYIYKWFMNEFWTLSHLVFEQTLNYLAKVAIGIPVVFHNGLNCGYHFIIRQPAEEFKG